VRVGKDPGYSLTSKDILSLVWECRGVCLPKIAGGGGGGRVRTEVGHLSMKKASKITPFWSLAPQSSGATHERVSRPSPFNRASPEKKTLIEADLPPYIFPVGKENLSFKKIAFSAFSCLFPYVSGRRIPGWEGEKILPSGRGGIRFFRVPPPMGEGSQGVGSMSTLIIVAC